MPEISRFFGIVILMYSETGARHHRAHFHARYQGSEAVYAIASSTRIEGELPARADRLVQAWAEIHRAELARNWTALLAGGIPARIAPLR